MKKRGKTLKYLSVFLLAFGIAFLFNIPKAFAGTAHQFSFEFYDCGGVVEADLTDTVNPDTNRVTTPAKVTCTGTNAKINPTTVTGEGSVIKLEKGKVVGVGVHYKPGSVSDYGMQFKYSYDTDSFEPLFFQIYDRKTKTYSQELAYTLDTDFKELYNRWEMFANRSNTRPNVLTFITNDSRGLDGDYLEDELNIVYTYFLVKEDATVNTGLDFTWDNTYGTGVAMNNTEPVSLTNAKGYIEVPLSEDNTLGTLSVTSGSTEYILDPEFTPGDENTDTYTAVVPNNITSVDISATANDAPRAILSGDTGTQSNLSVGNNQFTITVLSEAGTPKDYTVNVYRLNNVATLSALNLTNVDFGTFVSGTTSYTATVPYTTSSTTVSATPTDNKATVSGTGNKNLNVGTNNVIVSVNAENCKSQYSSVPGNSCTSIPYYVTVTREAPSTISTLNDLLANNTRVKGFQPGDESKTYTLDDVGYNTSTLNITYVKGEEHETVSGDGSKDLSVGNNSFDVVVTAQDGTTKTTYTIEVKRLSNNANLSGLNVTSSKTGSLTPGFAQGTTSYTYNTDADEDSVNISYTKAHDGATVVTTPANLTGINPKTTQSVSIEVTPEDTTQPKKTYTISFNVAKSTNNNLSSLTVNGTSVPNFDANTTTYNVTVPTDTDEATIVATPADDRSEVVIVPSDTALDYGDNTFTITVTPEDPNAEPKTYTVNITRTKKNISNLSNLMVDGTQVPGFQPTDSGKHYTIPDYGYNKDKVNITYVKGDDDETVTGAGNNISVPVGSSTKKVTVTAQNGTDKTEYYIDFYRKSNDATLSALSASAATGVGNIDFDPSTTSYTYAVGADETSVDVTYTTAHAGATVVTTPANLTGINPRTTESVSIEVTPEDTTQPKKTYTITFSVAKSTNADLSNLTINETQIEGFDPNTTEYNLTVGVDAASVNVGAELADDRASLSGDTGVQTLDYGENQLTITVTPEEPTAEPKTYTINIFRTKKDISTLSGLAVDGTPIEGFSPSTTEYTLDDVAYTKESVEITYTKGDDDETVSGDGTRTLSVGANALVVTVTAQNGTDKTEYTINIKRKSNDNTLKSLSVTSSGPGELDQDFDPTITNYIYTVGPDETSVTVSGEANNEFATVTGGDTVNPRDVGSVILTVTPEDGQPNYYIVTFDVTKSKNNNLSNLTIDGTQIEGFDPDQTEYTYDVDKDTSTVVIGYETEDPHSTVEVDQPEPLDYGENTITITVTPEDPNEEPKVYTITVNREKKDDATLVSISVDNEPIPGFAADQFEYTLDSVANNKDSVYITVVTNDEDATVEGANNRSLNVGDNPLVVTVTAQNGTTKLDYTINIRRRDTDNTLKSLTLTSDPAGTWNTPFDPEIKEYTYTVARDEDEVVIEAEANGDLATVSNTGTYNPQDTNQVQLIVTPEEGDTEIYTINIVKEKSDNADLDSLEVVNHDIGFTPGTTSYELNVDEDEDSVTINAHAADAPYATVSGDTGDHDLAYGTNTFTVTVTPEDPNAEAKTYTITINRALSSNVKLSDLKVNDETIEGFDPDQPSYTYTVENDVTSLDIDAIPADDSATASVDGADDLEVGENTITITVTAANDDKGYYTITVTRKGSSDNTLSGLEVEGHTLDPEFDPTSDDDHFTLTIPNDEDSITVTATPNEEHARVEVEGADNLQPGENTVTITVYPQDPDAEPKVYTITVTREEEDDEKITSIEYGHTIEDGMIKTVVYESLSETLKNQLDNDNDKLFIFDKNEEAEIAADKKLGTGMIIKLIKNGRENDRDFLVVKGDVNGDGIIKINDVVATVNQYLKTTEPLTGPYFAACDVAPKSGPDGEIKVNDVVGVVNRYLGQ